MKDLQESRKEIDSIDSEIVSLFERRMEVCKDVAEYKLRTGKAVLDRQRELDKIKTLKNKASSDFYAHGVEELFEQIMAMSRKMQYKLLTEEGVNNDIGFDKSQWMVQKSYIREFQAPTASRQLQNTLEIRLNT